MPLTGLPIAVDAMGGDNAPADIVAGAKLAYQQHGIKSLLVGDPNQIDVPNGLELLASSEVIGMQDEPAAAVRSKKDSSVVVAAKAVKDGQACAFLSAGNTGAAMAASLLKIGRIKGVSRPPIAIPIPVANSHPTSLLDVGANADCSAEMLLQFALLGVSYKRNRWGIDSPRVATLTIGEEAGKGNKLVKETCELFTTHDWGSVSATYIGNVEGNDLLTGAADVVVTDGFTGNVVLKTLEGCYDLFHQKVYGAVAGKSYEAEAKVDLDPMFSFHDPVSVGTGILLGIKQVAMICHGSSSPAAICSALKYTQDLVELDIVQKLRDDLAGV